MGRSRPARNSVGVTVHPGCTNWPVQPGCTNPGRARRSRWSPPAGDTKRRLHGAWDDSRMLVTIGEIKANIKSFLATDGERSDCRRAERRYDRAVERENRSTAAPEQREYRLAMCACLNADVIYRGVRDGASRMTRMAPRPFFPTDRSGGPKRRMGRTEFPDPSDYDASLRLARDAMFAPLTRPFREPSLLLRCKPGSRREGTD